MEGALPKVSETDNLLIQSDQCWPYQNPRYVKMFKDASIIQSMSRKGNCMDNGIMESFFGVIKEEMYYGFENDFNTFIDFKLAVTKYINHYNYERIRQKTKVMPHS